MGQTAGVLVIRVWSEGGRETPFRARVLAVGSPPEQIEVIAVVTTANEVVDIVCDWLAESASFP